MNWNRRRMFLVGIAAFSVGISSLMLPRHRTPWWCIERETQVTPTPPEREVAMRVMVPAAPVILEAFSSEVVDEQMAGRIYFRELLCDGSRPAAVDSVITGLTQVALTQEDPSRRRAAAWSILLWAEGRKDYPAGSVLQSLFDRTPDPSVQMRIIESASLTFPRKVGIGFLEYLANSSSTSDLLREGAIWELAEFGWRGRRVLRRLYESGAVQQERASLRLEQLARNGFRRSES